MTKFNIDISNALEGRVILNLGCGPDKPQGQIGIDRLDLPGVDIVCDLNDGMKFLPNNSVDEIHSHSLLEHIDDVGFLIEEIVRVLKPNSTCHIFVPHFSNPYFYSDYTHRRFMGLYTLYYFVDSKKQLSRKVPDFYTKCRIEIIYLNMDFFSHSRLLKPIKWVIERLVNSSWRAKEFYEENLCYLIPCYGMSIIFRPSEK